MYYLRTLRSRRSTPVDPKWFCFLFTDDSNLLLRCPASPAVSFSEMWKSFDAFFSFSRTFVVGDPVFPFGTDVGRGTIWNRKNHVKPKAPRRSFLFFIFWKRNSESQNLPSCFSSSASFWCHFYRYQSASTGTIETGNLLLSLWCEYGTAVGTHGVRFTVPGIVPYRIVHYYMSIILKQ